MKTVKKYYWIIGMVLVLSGCETTNSIPYKASTENIITIQQVINSTKKKITLGSFTLSSKADLMCRLMGPVKVAPGKTLEEYVRAAFQEELFLAQAYAVDSDVVLSGNINALKFSSVSPAYWDISMTIRNQEGQSYQVSTNYQFSTSYSAYSACKNVADAFAPTVQRLIQQVVLHPEFKNLVSARDHVSSKEAPADKAKVSGNRAALAR